MGYNFNLPNFFQNMRLQPGRISRQTSEYSPILQPYSSSSATPSYSTSGSSFFDMTELISSFKAKFTTSYLKSFGLSQPEIKTITQPEEKKVYDSTVMQNYGIVCPVKTDKDEDVKISLVAQNYGIMCPLDIIGKTEPKETFKLADVDQNYGIVCPPKEEITGLDTKIKYDGARMFANYGIVCPSDVKKADDAS